MTTASSLTGIWQGFFAYASGGDRHEFTATLIETGSRFGGSVHETCQAGEDAGAMLLSLVDGTKGAGAVRFVKTYDGSHGWNHSVIYEGALNPDATEIRGRWHVPGGYFGQFVMIRPAGRALSVERRQLAKV